MATNCTNILSKMEWCQGKPVLPGIRRRAYVIAANDIATWPDYERDSLGRPSSAELKGKFVLNESAKFKAIDHLADKAETKSEAQGEFPSQTFNNQVTLVHPEVGPEATAAITPFLNTECVVIVEDMYGRYRVFGSKNWPAKISPAQDLGQGATGTSSTTLTVAASDEVSMPFYAGQIPTDDGVINEGVGSV